MHKSLSGMGSSDHNESSRGAVGKSSSSLFGSTAGGAQSSKFLLIGVDMKVGISDLW